MNFDLGDLVLVLDRAGIIAFALSGVEVGLRRRLDIFGLLVMGVVTAVGGGMVRDVLLTRTPLALENADYILWAVGASLLAVLVFGTRRRVPRPLLAIADAAGLGAFCAAGALAGIQAELPVTAVVFLAIVTGTGGGVIRDLLADRVPMVLRAEVNATAAALGGLTVWALEPVASGTAAVAGLAVAAAVRVASLALNIHLPVPGGRRSLPRGRQ